ncbi:hypothetical protein ES703_113129 [subsurface metagenome]
MVSGSALRDKNCYLKLAVVISFIVSTLNVHIATIKFHREFFVFNKASAGNLNLGADDTLIRVYLNLTTDHLKLINRYYFIIIICGINIVGSATNTFIIIPGGKRRRYLETPIIKLTITVDHYTSIHLLIGINLIANLVTGVSFISGKVQCNVGILPPQRNRNPSPQRLRNHRFQPDLGQRKSLRHRRPELGLPG